MTEFYTYVWLREDDTPYYVGKGSRERAYTSWGHGVRCPADRAKIVVYPAQTETEALEVEIALIWYYGRKDLGTGCLRNLTDGGENPPSAKGLKRSNETRSTMRASMLKSKPWHHGTGTGHQKYKCRYEACLQWYVGHLEATKEDHRNRNGVVDPEETRRKRRLAKLGHKDSPETKEKRNASRAATFIQNGGSKASGVHKELNHGVNEKWVVRLRVNGKMKRFGMFNSKEEAISHSELVKKQLKGELNAR